MTVTLQTINVGNSQNDNTGDSARVAFTKINANFSALGNAQVSFLTPSGDTSGVGDTYNFKAAYAYAVANSISGVPGAGANSGTVIINFAAGTYYINASEAMMSHVTPTYKINGLVFQGAGWLMTTIVYNPTVSGPLCVNQWWSFIQFRQMSFFCQDASGNSNFMNSAEQGGISNIQGATFDHVSWGGTWGDLFYLTGANNNSEWKFIDCDVGLGPTTINNWFNVPVAGSGGNDQFLNFWFLQCGFSPLSGTWMNMNLGGSINIDQCDIGGWQPTVDTYAFNLLGSSHASGVCKFECNGLRMESVSDHALLLHTQWPIGTISFRDYDQSSQMPYRTATVQYVYVDMSGGPGAMIRFEQCQLLGKHGYNTQVSNFKWPAQIVYDQCSILQQPDATSFINQTNSGNTGGIPIIHFYNCRNPNLDYSTSQPIVVFDTDLNWQFTMGANLRTRVVNLVGINSDAPTGGAYSGFEFPLNAVIVRVRMQKAVSGAGGAYNYSLQTIEGTPTVIAAWSGANATVAFSTDSAISTGGGLAASQGPVLYYPMSSTATRTLHLLDVQNRVGNFINFALLVDYIG